MTAPGVPGWLVFNGEIYNFKELRAELKRDGVAFRTQSDTEVILQMYRKYGQDMLNHLNGIFSLAIWDEIMGRLFCARDPLGTRPFYWTQADGRFLFASEVKVLLDLPGVEARVNPKALAQHLAYIWCPSPASAFRGIQKLEPGHRMWVDAEGRVISDESYFTWEYQEDDRLPLAARIEATRDQVLSAVQRQLVSDVPVGLFLSGGLDSSAIAAAYRCAAPDANIEAFCSVTEAGEGFVQDLPYARKVADHLGIRLHALEVKCLDLEHWKALLWHLEEPQADPAVHHVDQIARLARERGMKVLLSGTGGDDLFSGYRRHQLIAQERLRMALPGFARLGLSRLGKALPRGSAFLRRTGKALDGMELDTPQRIASLFEWLAPDVVGSLLGCSPQLEGRQALAHSLDNLPPGTSPLNQMLFMETRGFLPDHNLNYIDKLSMAHGVETRVPLLDLVLVAHANALPTGDKLHGTTTKWILKKAMEPLLPREVIYRPKTGFGAPLREWLAGSMKTDMEAHLSPEHLRKRGWFDPLAVQRLWRDTLAGRVDGTYALWTVVTVDLWAEAFHIT